MPRTPSETSIPGRVLEALDLDGGWLTVDGLSLLLPDCRPESIDRAMWRLRQRGEVENRVVKLAMGYTSKPRRGDWGKEDPSHGFVESRMEWRSL